MWVQFFAQTPENSHMPSENATSTNQYIGDSEE